MKTSCHPPARQTSVGEMGPRALRSTFRHLPLLAALFALVSLGLAGCSSTRGSAPSAMGQPARIRFLSGRSQQSFQLVNETHTNRVELYSTTRTSADTKVQTDEVMDAMLDYFAEQGLFERTQPGGAPTDASLSSLEIEVAGAPVFFAVGPGSSAEDIALFGECRNAFIGVYNETYQLQSLERQPDWAPSLPTNR